MKELITYVTTLLFAVTLSLVGTSNAGWFGSDKPETKSDTTMTPSGPERAVPEGRQLTLSGTIDENSQFVDAKGEIFSLANNEKGMEVKSLFGKRVEIKGTVMEKEGQKIVEVREYNILSK